MRKIFGFWAPAVGVGLLVACAPSATETTEAPEPVMGQIVMGGDLNWFRGGELPGNCTAKSRYERGEPVGFRMTAVDGLTGDIIPDAELEVHLQYAGGVVDLPMIFRGVPQGDRPIHPTMWTAKWMVPDDAPTGIIRYTVTATDSSGRTAEWEPFETDLSQLTIVE